MSSATTLHLKFLERYDFTTSIPKPSYPSLPRKQIQFSPISISLRTTISHFNIIPYVAQTSEWAQQEVKEEDEEGENETDEEIAASHGDRDSTESREEATLFVRNMPYDVDSQALAELFQQAGVVEVTEVKYDKKTGYSRGFGFVRMSTVEEAEKAKKMFHGYDLNRRILTVTKADPKGTRPKSPPPKMLKVFVANLPSQVDDAQLEQLFSKHGTVVRAIVVYDPETGRSRRYGFVTLSSESDVNAAIAALDGWEWDGRRIDVAVAVDKPRQRRSV